MRSTHLAISGKVPPTVTPAMGVLHVTVLVMKGRQTFAGWILHIVDKGVHGQVTGMAELNLLGSFHPDGAAQNHHREGEYAESQKEHPLGCGFHQSIFTKQECKKDQTRRDDHQHQSPATGP